MESNVFIATNTKSLYDKILRVFSEHYEPEGYRMANGDYRIDCENVLRWETIICALHELLDKVDEERSEFAVLIVMGTKPEDVCIARYGDMKGAAKYGVRTELTGFMDAKYDERPKQHDVGTVEYDGWYGFSLTFTPAFSDMLEKIQQRDEDEWYDMWAEIRKASPVEIKEYDYVMVEFGEVEDICGWSVEENGAVNLPRPIQEARDMIAKIVLKTYKGVHG